MIKARINKVIDSSVVDGPGNRTAIFFQGCNFNCKYCHNPETINNCINCKECVPKCPVQALSVVEGKVHWNKEICIDCDACIKVCRFNASPKIQNLSVEEVVNHIKKNMPFIQGITTSGGECTLQKDFLIPLFKETRKLGLTNFIDSNGSIKFSDYPELMEYTDSVMLDVKAFDNEEHLDLTSKANEIVLENARYLASIGKLFEIRTVVIDNYLNNRKTVYEITNMLKEYQKVREIRYKIIRYRHFGVREEYKNMRAPSENEMKNLKEIANNNGFSNVLLV
ncbi:YjjW family glycine radical enzyme activase [Candidatus Clostridium radicumherbarum]|uniref:YjjW family glycine radical enzyme activase n=1 Tax=Candidatus Clostridium radicumherbarum TaxID=3381662 RepID=A0ABW8TPQ2_9CLOT